MVLFVLGIFIGGIIGIAIMAVLNYLHNEDVELFNLYDLENQEKDDAIEDREK